MIICRCSIPLTLLERQYTKGATAEKTSLTDLLMIPLQTPTEVIKHQHSVKIKNRFLLKPEEEKAKCKKSCWNQM